jgi:hypothetical protein
MLAMIRIASDELPNQWSGNGVSVLPYNLERL